MPYPLTIRIDAETGRRNRLTTAFRPILAIPHAVFVGPLFWPKNASGAGAIGAAAGFAAVISWFTLLARDVHLRGLRELSLFYLRWRLRALAYMALFVDAYPPFGDGEYPASLEISDPANPRDRTGIALRIIFAIPHIICLVFLLFAWFVTTVIAWISIILSGAYPASLLPFGMGVARWLIRVEAYVLLLTDEYPPFTLGPP